MGWKGAHCGIGCFAWFLLATAATRHAGAATVFWTAYVEISYRNASDNQTVTEVSESGLYGLNSPLDEVEGRVELPVTDPLACGRHTKFNNTDGPWIALIERGNCTFAEKIKAATESGATAVVIYNLAGTGNERSPMVHHGTGGTVAIMIGYIRGMEIVSLIKKGIAVTMSIEVGKQHGPWMSHYSVFFVSISFFVVTAATVGYFIFYSARRLNSVRMQNRKQKQLKAEAKKAIGQLLVRTLKQDDRETGPDADTCAVCIDVYKPGDVVVTLTCNHFFHKTCIEPWLLEHRTCPMCKCDILKALGIEQPDVEEASHQVPLPPDFRSFPSIPEDTRSETASSGYASVQGTEEHTVPAEETAVYETVHELARQNPDPDAVQVDIQPHYDNLAFEGDSQRHVDPRT
ncbi:E3 ubiquitin-protein ligase RNF128a isoform X3 [Megalops cyprinoides]|uniref:E3 ubiquitin-protein ligase RNF128a isoform X3 n=1 Tax=Megalops cyprinoides TaxID=118141 RepID=UPI0018644ACD|nr:E3 ubiquitin-protein ligase RNF128a isoform X3 [Megalops cyprinoides]